MPIVISKIAGLILAATVAIGGLSINFYQSSTKIDGNNGKYEYTGEILPDTKDGIDGGHISKLTIYKKRGGGLTGWPYREKVLDYDNGAWNIYPAPEYESVCNDMIDKIDKSAKKRFKRQNRKGTNQQRREERLKDPKDDVTDKLLKQGL